MNSLLALDGNILLLIQDYVRSEMWTPFWLAITSLGDGLTAWGALSVALLIPKRTRPVGLAALLSMSVCFLCTNVVLKNAVARIRPYETVAGLTALIPYPKDYSFPSGHTSASFACALILARTLPKKYGIPALVLASLIAFSRLYVGVHYPTDILGGLAIAFAGSSLVLFLWKKRTGGYGPGADLRGDKQENTGENP